MSRTHLPTLTTQPRLQWDVFCRVIDNWGDIGVCWRLAAQLPQFDEALVMATVSALIGTTGMLQAGMIAAE